MEKAKVSIITPTYNRESIAKAIGSAVNQPNVIEHIVVDDCSDDAYWALLQNLAEKSAGKVRIARAKTNQGPGAARNMGLQLARGEYVFFLDSDDILAPGAIERLVNEATRSQADIVLPLALYSDNRVHGQILPSDKCSAEIFANCAAIKDLGPCKLFRREFLIKNDVIFPSRKYFGEDQITILKCYLHATKISIMADQPSLFLGESQDSLTRNANSLDILGVMQEVALFANSLSKYDVNRLIILRRVFNNELRYVANLMETENERDGAVTFINEKMMPELDGMTKNIIDDAVIMFLDQCKLVNSTSIQNNNSK